MWRTNEKVERYTYGSGSGTLSVDMDPQNFVTTSLSGEMNRMIDDIQKIWSDNWYLVNIYGIDLSTKLDHCTVLVYYDGRGLKKSTSLS